MKVRKTTECRRRREKSTEEDYWPQLLAVKHVPYIVIGHWIRQLRVPYHAETHGIAAVSVDETS